MTNKYFFKDIYNKTNKKEYNLQIRQYNIRHTNIIIIKNVILAAEKGRENRKLLAIKNIDKTAIAEFAKVSNIINLSNKYS